MDRRSRTVVIILVIAAAAVAAGWALRERGEDDDDERTESSERLERKTASPPPQLSTDAQERTAALAERMAQIGVADRGDCGKLAADLRKLGDEQKPPLLETSPTAKLQETEQDEAFLSTRGLDGAHAARVQAANRQMQPSLDACKADSDVAGAINRLTR
jgi:hypothetical protein